MTLYCVVECLDFGTVIIQRIPCFLSVLIGPLGRTVLATESATLVKLNGNK